MELPNLKVPNWTTGGVIGRLLKSLPVSAVCPWDIRKQETVGSKRTGPVIPKSRVTFTILL